MRLIQDQHEALVRTQRLKDALASFVVHDLKSPLASVAVSIDAASIDSGLDPETQECLAGAREAVDTMSRLILNLLDISKSEGGALTTSLRDIDLGDLVRDVVASVRPRALRRGVPIAFERGD